MWVPMKIGDRIVLLTLSAVTVPSLLSYSSLTVRA